MTDNDDLTPLVPDEDGTLPGDEVPGDDAPLAPEPLATGELARVYAALLARAGETQVELRLDATRRACELLGDILICIVRAQEHAEAYGHGLLRELCFLTVHGMLHLAGYDHVEPDEEREMNALCEKILSEMHVPRV